MVGGMDFGTWGDLSLSGWDTAATVWFLFLFCKCWSGCISAYFGVGTGILLRTDGMRYNR